MQKMFLETEGYTISALREPDEAVMTIDYAERYDDERLAQGYDTMLVFAMRDELIDAIAELRSTIAAKDVRIAELAAALERTQQSREHRTNLLLTSMDKSGARIAELEIQLAAALVTIERQGAMFYVVTDNGRLLDSSPVAHDDLQHLADSENIGVYEIRGVRTGRYADPKTEIERLRIVAIEGDTVWAFTDDFGGERTLYSGVIGQPLDVVGASMAGIPANCPPHVSDIFWTKK